MNKRSLIIALVVIMAAVSAVLLWQQREQPAPPVAFTLIQGNTLELAALRGRPVLVNFWSTSCAICIEEMPAVLRLYQELHPRGLELVAVAMPYDPPIRVVEFTRQHQIPYPVALDITAEALQAFAPIPGTPTWLLISPTGAIVYRHSGKLEMELLKGRITSLLIDQPGTQDAGLFRGTSRLSALGQH